MIDIVVVDDHDLIREGFRKIISKTQDMQVSGEARNAEQAFEVIAEKKCDVLILDINLPDRNGLDVLKSIKSVRPDISVLILSVYPEERFAIRALRAGASGYVTKESAAKELVQAIRKVASAGKYVSETLAERMAADLSRDQGNPSHKALSDREFQVLLLIGSARTTAEIAEMLSLSINTVNTYRSRILEKMNMKSNAELIRYVVENRLID
jgi:DNA-binding NarL/FixJ family response regulator